MKMKFYLVAIALITAFAVYAGIAHIDYKTGDFECSNGFTGNNYACSESGIRNFGVEQCHKEISNICDP